MNLDSFDKLLARKDISQNMRMEILTAMLESAKRRDHEEAKCAEITNLAMAEVRAAHIRSRGEESIREHRTNSKFKYLLEQLRQQRYHFEQYHKMRMANLEMHTIFTKQLLETFKQRQEAAMVSLELAKQLEVKKKKLKSEHGSRVVTLDELFSEVQPKKRLKSS